MTSLAETVGGRDFLAESRGNGPDTRALHELARAGTGLYAPTPVATLRTEGPRGREPLPTWPFVLRAAALLVTIDLWLRRLPPRRAIAARAGGMPIEPTP